MNTAAAAAADALFDLKDDVFVFVLLAHSPSHTHSLDGFLVYMKSVFKPDVLLVAIMNKKRRNVT